MPSNESVLIDGYIAAAQAERDEPLRQDIAFETFGAQMVLREHNLSDEQIEVGRVGGGKDGAIDGVYVFLDGELLDEDSEIFENGFSAKSVRKGAELTLRIIQSKEESGFTETAFDKLDSSLSRFLDLNLSDDQLLVYYSPEVISRMRLFTRAWKVLAIRSPSIAIRVDYVSKGDTANPAPAVLQKGADLAQKLMGLVPGASASSHLVGARELWEIANSVPEYDLQLRFTEYLSRGESYTGLVNLADYYEFLTDEEDALRGHLFDWNVRDFQGGVAVNRGIEATLESDLADDFWWLNNGVTILCSDVTISGDKTFTMQNVQIVNGMQTSYSIHNAISKIGADEERKRGRSVLVRVFETQDEATRDRIIRATNSQTKVPDASLHATEDIHRQLEAYFVANGWFYDRRKNYYKNNGKPADRIVSISALGQAIMAIGLGRPDDARARPSSLLNNATDYKSVFTEKIPLPTYLWVAQFQRRVDTLLLNPDVAEAYLRTNFRFHVSLYLATKLLGVRIYSPAQLTQLSSDPVQITSDDVAEAMQIIVDEAESVAQNEDYSIDRVAKSRAFAELVIDLALGEPTDEDAADLAEEASAS